jgi:hypothetical protein
MWARRDALFWVHSPVFIPATPAAGFGELVADQSINDAETSGHCRTIAAVDCPASNVRHHIRLHSASCRPTTPSTELHDGEGDYSLHSALKVHLLHGATVCRIIDDIFHMTPRTEDGTLMDDFLLTYRAYVWPVQLLLYIRARFEAAEGANIPQIPRP